MNANRAKTKPYQVGEVKPKGKKPAHPWRIHVEKAAPWNSKGFIPHRDRMGLKV